MSPSGSILSPRGDGNINEDLDGIEVIETFYPREGTVTPCHESSDARGPDAFYPREGTVTRWGAGNCRRCLSTHFIPARGLEFILWTQKRVNDHFENESMLFTQKIGSAFWKDTADFSTVMFIF